MTAGARVLAVVAALSSLPGAAAGGSGRVVDYAGEESPPAPSGADVGPRRPDTKEKTDTDSVQLITGGDSDEGSARVGRLPVLD